MASEIILNIIHLPHRIDRWTILMEELRSQSISNYRIWDGIIDGGLSCRGISKAHKQIVAFAKLNHMQYVLIGEDDLHFTAPGAFNFYCDNIPQDFDLFLGGIT